MLDLRRLRLLRELSLRGTLASVAEALNYSPSGVSQQLSQLEREVGIPLLRPVGRRVQLTPEAEILVARTEEILTVMERAEAELAEAGGERPRNRAARHFPNRGARTDASRAAAPARESPRGAA